MEKYLLKEAQIDSLELFKVKYPQSIILHRVIDELYEADPTEKKSLFLWMVKQNIETAHKADVNNNVVRVAKEFNLLRDKLKIRDINFYHTLDILQNEINRVKANLSKAEKKKFKIEEGEVIYEDSHFEVINPVSEYEICNAGFDTAWCGTKGKIPDDIDGYVCFVIINKTIKHPNVNDTDDYESFNQLQERYFKYKKLLLFISKRFKGEIHEADFDDYMLIDGMNEEYEGSLFEVTNQHIESVIFRYFKENTNKPVRKALNEQYQNPELKEGDTVVLIYMFLTHPDKPPIGSKGTVESVISTPYGKQYTMKWENGSTFALDPEEDIFKKFGTLNEIRMDEKTLSVLKKHYEGKTFKYKFGNIKVNQVEDNLLDVEKGDFRDGDGVWFYMTTWGIKADCYRLKEMLREEIMLYFNIHLHFNTVDSKGEY